jgi:hypothetical protein
MGFFFSKPKITNKMNKPSKPTEYNAVSKNSYLPPGMGYVHPDNVKGGYKKNDKNDKNDKRYGKYKHNNHTHKTINSKKKCKK